MQFPTPQRTRTNQMNQTVNKTLKTQRCYVTACVLAKTQQTKNVLNKKQKTSARYKRTLGVCLLNHHIPSTLCLDSCFSDSALDVTAEAEDVSVVTEVICRHETTDFKIFTNRMINATAQKQSATDFRGHKVREKTHRDLIRRLEARRNSAMTKNFLSNKGQQQQSDKWQPTQPHG